MSTEQTAEALIEEQKITALAANLARLLGNKGDGRRYLWRDGLLHVYVDDENFFTLIHWQGEQMVSTVADVFIPGKWIDVVMGYRDQVRQAEQQATEQRFRQTVFA